MKNYSSFLIIIAFAISSSCAPHKHQNAPNKISTTSEPTDSLLTSIERGACFGACPEYQANIYKSGFAEYFGRKNVKNLGYFIGKVPKEQMQELLELIRTNKIEELDSNYVNKHLADYPSYSIRIADKKPRRMIQVMEPNPPAQLSAFTSLLDRIVSQIEWTRMNPTNDR
ncbi:hypothetical protein BH11BAC2_BH11BAC2_05940 [soil metagenome]